jgi:hypothetical protein
MKLRVSADVEIDPTQVRDGKVSELWILSAFDSAFREFFQHGDVNEVMAEHGLVEVTFQNISLHRVVPKPEAIPGELTSERMRRILLVTCPICRSTRGMRCRNKNSDGILQAMSTPHVAREDRAIQQGTIGRMETPRETQDQHRT